MKHTTYLNDDKDLVAVCKLPDKLFHIVSYSVHSNNAYISDIKFNTFDDAQIELDQLAIEYEYKIKRR